MDGKFSRLRSLSKLQTSTSQIREEERVCSFTSYRSLPPSSPSFQLWIYSLCLSLLLNYFFSLFVPSSITALLSSNFPSLRVFFCRRGYKRLVLITFTLTNVPERSLRCNSFSSYSLVLSFTPTLISKKVLKLLSKVLRTTGIISYNHKIFNDVDQFNIESFKT